MKQYPIGQFILRAMQNRGLSPADFIRELGFRNLNKGLRRLNVLVQTGIAENSFIDKLSQFALDKDELEDSLFQTQLMLEAESIKKNEAEEIIIRQKFQPYLIPEVEHQTPSQICLSALCGGVSRYKRYFSRNFHMLSRKDKAICIQEVIRRHYSQNKRTLFNGAITGYLLVESFDLKPQRFTIEGVYVGHAVAVCLDEPMLFVGRKKWVGIFHENSHRAAFKFKGWEIRDP